MNERVHVLLPAHNRCAVTEKCIVSLAAQTWDNLHLIFIDDGCTDGSAEMVLRHLPQATVLRGTGDWWWAGSLQQGFDWLQHESAGADDIVLILNDDTTFGPEFVAAAVAVLRQRRRALLLAHLYDGVGKLVEVGVHADWRVLGFWGVMEPEKVNCFATRGLFLRVGDIREIGGFHTVLLPHYGSDYEYTMRAHRKGFALISDGGVRISYSEETTGLRQAQKQPLRAFLRAAFSKRAIYNPFYWSMFVTLTCPARYVPMNVYRVWRSFGRQVLEAIR